MFKSYTQIFPETSTAPAFCSHVQPIEHERSSAARQAKIFAKPVETSKTADTKNGVKTCSKKHGLLFFKKGKNDAEIHRRFAVLSSLISLIQISSSSKGRRFLCTTGFFCFKSSTCQLFNHVLPGPANTGTNMNNFAIQDFSVDN